jgi:transglycosylase-like protein with SLT domain
VSGVRQAAVLALLCSALIGSALAWPGRALADPPGRSLPVTVGRICAIIEREAGKHGLPRDFFARLIFKESRFDPGAVSPAGAEGIAQFMPGTAAIRGLDDSFDIGKALPASAKYLGELKTGFGNLGLAAAAYNAGEARVTRWLSSVFSDANYAGTVQPLHPALKFGEACRKLPVTMSEVVAMSTVQIKPWGVQVAGNMRRAVAVRQWQRVKARFPALLAGHEPAVSRVRPASGPRRIYAVRIGAESRKEANVICSKLRQAGGFCVVLKNR